MIKALRFTCAALLLATVVPNVAHADIIFSYTGQLYTVVEGTAFSTADRITGTVTFDKIGATEAKAFSLSTTMKGLPGFTIEWDRGDLGGLDPISNSFKSWQNSKPNEWNIYVSSDVSGSPDWNEDINITEIGDLAALDFLGGEGIESIGSTFSRGDWAVVPEPSSMALFAVGSVLGFAALRRRRGR